MARILGLDVGTNSIGWALIDDAQNKILGIGSRIFPMAVENLGDNCPSLHMYETQINSEELQKGELEYQYAEDK